MQKNPSRRSLGASRVYLWRPNTIANTLSTTQKKGKHKKKNRYAGITQEHTVKETVYTPPKRQQATSVQPSSHHPFEINEQNSGTRIQRPRPTPKTLLLPFTLRDTHHHPQVQGTIDRTPKEGRMSYCKQGRMSYSNDDSEVDSWSVSRSAMPVVSRGSFQVG